MTGRTTSWRETAQTYATVYEHVYKRPIGDLPIEERREPSRAWHPRCLLGRPYLMAREASDEVEIEEEDDEVF